MSKLVVSLSRPTADVRASVVIVSDIAIFVLKRDVKLQLTNFGRYVVKNHARHVLYPLDKNIWLRPWHSSHHMRVNPLRCGGSYTSKQVVKII